MITLSILLAISTLSLVFVFLNHLSFLKDYDKLSDELVQSRIMLDKWKTVSWDNVKNFEDAKFLNYYDAQRFIQTLMSHNEYLKKKLSLLDNETKERLEREMLKQEQSKISL